jgi:hypothetical protein
VFHQRRPLERDQALAPDRDRQLVERQPGRTLYRGCAPLMRFSIAGRSSRGQGVRLDLLAVPTLYWMSISHPSQAARMMLEMKGVEYALVNVLPLTQRIHLRLAGFRGGTVPALRLDDGVKVQGSLLIARALDARWPPPLFPADRVMRARVEEAERWGERELQPIPRRLARFGGAHFVEVRRWGLEGTRLPGIDLLARIGAPLVGCYARANEPDGAARTRRACAPISPPSPRSSTASTRCWRTGRSRPIRPTRHRCRSSPPFARSRRSPI